MYELINNVPLKIKEYKGHRVVTFKDIDTVHGRPEGTAGRNFRKNRTRFVENEDFFILKLTNDEIRRQFDAGKNAGKTMILLTETGYLMLVKSFTDNLAWGVQRQLVNTYFRVQITGNSYDEHIYKKLELLEKKIDDLEKKTEKIASDTCVTLRPAFIQLHEKVNRSDKRIEKLSANFASEVSGRLRPHFRSLETRIKSLIKSSERNSKDIVKTLNDNTKSIDVYIDTLLNMFK